MNKIIVNNPKNVINSKIGKNYFKLVGTGGPKGDKGDKGDTGTAATISAGTASSLPAGSSPTVTNSGTSSAAVFNFGIPKGDKGDKGDTGATGAAATITVGSTTTGAAGTNASVTNTGTSGAAVFNFTIPRGDKGETGATGATGATGQAATIAVGSTTTLTPGSSATVTNSGTSSAATFNFGIPQGVKGDTGSVKSAYVTSLPSTGNENTYYLNGDTATTGSVSGTAVQITNADNTGEISDFKLNGNTEQTTYTGKNLFNKATATQGYRLGSDGSAFSDADYYVSAFIPVSQNTAYYISGTSGTIDSSAVCFYASDKSFISRRAFINDWYSFTTPANTAFLRFTTLKTNSIDQVQLELGSTATAYEPYVGGIASPNPDYPQAVNVVTGEQVVKVEGKNLFDKTTATQNKFVDASGLIVDNATALVSDYIHIEPNTDYYVSGRTLWNSIALYDGSKTFIERRNLSYVNGVVNITNTSCAYIRINASVGDLNNIQLELGNQATTYEAYRGTDYEVNLGKNLLNEALMAQGSFNYITGAENADVYRIRSPLIACASNTTYTASANKVLGECGVVFYEADGTTVIRGVGGTVDAQSYTFTTKSDAKYMRIRFGSVSSPFKEDQNYNLQLELGSQATSYSAYFTPIELCKIGTYQDYIYKDNGTWKVHKANGKITFNGSENWIMPSSGNYCRYDNSDFKPSSSTGSVSLGYSDNYTAYSYNNIYDGVPDYGFAFANSNRIVIRNKDMASASAFQTWLSSHNTTVYYILNTATDTAITESALITQLDNLVSAELLSGVNNIMLVPANQPDGTMSIDYTTWDKHDRYDVYIWNDTIGDYQLIHAGGGNN